MKHTIKLHSLYTTTALLSCWKPTEAHLTVKEYKKFMNDYKTGKSIGTTESYIHASFYEQDLVFTVLEMEEDEEGGRYFTIKAMSPNHGIFFLSIFASNLYLIRPLE
jgi:hypothetical protein